MLREGELRKTVHSVWDLSEAPNLPRRLRSSRPVVAHSLWRCEHVIQSDYSTDEAQIPVYLLQVEPWRAAKALRPNLNRQRMMQEPALTPAIPEIASTTIPELGAKVPLIRLSHVLDAGLSP